MVCMAFLAGSTGASPAFCIPLTVEGLIGKPLSLGFVTAFRKLDLCLFFFKL